MKITEQINFHQPKYVLPAILYIPLLIASYFIFDLFNAKKAEIPDDKLKTTEYLNPEIPDATIRDGDGIGSKYENMSKSWGKIADYSAVDNIERDEPQDNKEVYESQYTEEDVAKIQEQADVPETKDISQREKEALAELEKALAEARLKGQQAATPIQEVKDTIAPPPIEVKGQIAEDSKAVKAISDEQEASAVVKKVMTSSDYFNTLSQDEKEPKLITAIIDENIKAVDGSRIRLRLLDDVEINDRIVKRGTYLYAIMSGFSSQRIKGSINSILVGDELVKVNLSLYDTDGLEGLYVPYSHFRETSKDVVSGAVMGNMNMNNGTTGNSLTQWGMQAIQNAYQKTSNAIGKAIKKNKAKLKYGTFVYIINSKEVK